MAALVISTIREGYCIGQVKDTMTIGELKAFLNNYDDNEDDMPIYLSFDNGYTYGGITEYRIEEFDGEEEE